MRRAGGVASVVLLLAGAFILGLLATRTHGVPGGPARVLAATPPDRQPTLLAEVQSELVAGYVREVGLAVLAAPSVDDALAALADPYTSYLDPEEYADLRRRTARSYSGVGLTVGVEKDGLIVTSAVPGPARAAGIRRGDVIVAVDGRPVDGLGFERALELIKGEEGTLVRLEVRRGDGGTSRYTIIREAVAWPSVRSRIVKTQGRRLGYLRVLSFPAGAATRAAEATASLAARDAEGLILDLRGNAGGLLAEAVQTASLYLGDAVVCVVDGRRQPRRVYTAGAGPAHPDLPLVVLVDAGTASAAEVVAAALGEHGRAAVVGQQTFGKASVQSVRPLSNGGALTMTVATYRTPNGHDLASRGSAADVPALDDPLTRPDEAVVAAEVALIARMDAAARRPAHPRRPAPERT